MKQLPIHQTISNQIRSEIQGGKYPVGAKLPTEEELCALYNTSRPTLRQALSTLSAEGLINRRPRTGSTVIATQPPIFLSHAVGAVNELLDYPGVMTRKILDTSLIRADAQLAKEIQCPIGQEWFRIVSLRFQNHASLPLCLTTYYILPKYAQVIKHPNHLSTPISEQIVDMYDVVIEKGTYPRIPTFVIKLDGELLSSYRADGIIIATSTGSTAYSMSAGGPIIAPKSNVFVITPICPHMLTVRPLVISDDKVIEVSVDAPDGEFPLNCDGHFGKFLAPQEVVIVKKSAELINLVANESRTYCEILRTKLLWGREHNFGL